MRRIFTARSGAPLAVGTLNGSESFGETQTCGHANDGAVLTSKYTGGTTAIYNINVPNSATGAGINSNAANGGNNINMFSQSGYRSSTNSGLASSATTPAADQRVKFAD